MLLVLHPLQPILSTAKLCLLPGSPLLHLEELSCLQKRSFERDSCPEGQQLPSCSSQGQGQGQRAHLCQIQLRLYHGLLIPEGVQKNGLTPVAGKSDIVLSDAPETEVFCMFSKHQWGLLYITVHFCHRWARRSSGINSQVSTPPCSSLELSCAPPSIIVLFVYLRASPQVHSNIIFCHLQQVLGWSLKVRTLKDGP